MNAGPSGFHNAPVTRAFVVACALFTIFLGLQRQPSSAFGLSHQDIFKKLNIWRVVSSTFAFSSTADLMFGLYLFYYFRVFERQIGSNKYSVFILFSLVVSFLFEVLAFALLKDCLPNLLASGPYGLIFSLFIPFLLDIPISTRFRVFGFYVSDKSFIYLVGLQLLVSSWKRSLLPGFCGVLSGSLYRLNVLGIRRMKFPDFVTSLFSWILWPVMGGSSSATLRRTIVGSVHPYPGHQVGRNYRPSAPLVSIAEPPEDSIATLVSMGFERNSARQALMQARNDINAATNILLETPSH